MMLRTEYAEEQFILMDRITKIKSIINKYGEENFYIAFSGGKDSTVLSALIDLAVPDNKIPRVYANTGIELNMVRDHVFDLAKTDDRIKIIRPSVPVKPMLEKDGYPFKSKNHARLVDRFYRKGMLPSIHSYLGEGSWGPRQQCPKTLRYQFNEEFSKRLHLSDVCCLRMKEEPLTEWSKENNRPYGINGIMCAEGGRRSTAVCTVFKNKKLSMFQPLSVVTKDWEDWFIKEYNVNICPIYLPPYNFERTGCKGCPFALHLEKELDTLETYFPDERKQCEIIWGPVYDEYRRLGYRLKKKDVCNAQEPVSGEIQEPNNMMFVAERIDVKYKQMTVFDY